MMDISVQLTYNKFYNEEEYQIDLLKVKNNEHILIHLVIFNRSKIL